ncbi:MAG: ATP-binding protein, partial [Sphingobacteriales bacterium]
FGLGLSIVSRLCEVLNHSLTLHSRPGRGTVFRLELVAARGQPTESPLQG